MAAALPRLAPNAPHLLHLPSHLYIRLGRYADAMRANQVALASQVRMTQQLEAQGFKLLTGWNSHLRRFLWIAAQIEGDSGTAMAQAAQLADSAGAKSDDWSEFLRAMPLLTMAHFAQWSSILRAAPSQAEPSTLAPNALAFARGSALLQAGRTAEAERDIQTLEKLKAEALAKGADGKSGAAFAGLMLAPLKASQAFAKGDIKAARSILTLGLADEPEFGAPEGAVWAASAQRSLGNGLLRAGHWRGAEAAFRTDLRQLPRKVWALRGLHQALLGQGRKPEANRVLQQWRRAGLEADANLRP